MNKQILSSLIVGVLVISFSGCSSVMAVKQPDKKNMSILNSGGARDSIIAEFGMPVGTVTKNGKKVETYQYNQGYSKGNKWSRAIAYGVLDVLTLFIWEIIGIPIELVANGKQKTVKVTYDSQDLVEDISFIQS